MKVHQSCQKVVTTRSDTTMFLQHMCHQICHELITTGMYHSCNKSDILVQCLLQVAPKLAISWEIFKCVREMPKKFYRLISKIPKLYTVEVYHRILTSALFCDIFLLEILSCLSSWIFVEIHDASQAR